MNSGLSEQPESVDREAEKQITTEQILQDAFSIRDAPLQRPQQSILDLDELHSYQLTKRREYEQQLNKNRLNFGQWLRYARWEIDHNHDFSRARSIFERALEVNLQHIPFWTHYIQFELIHKNINHARNILDRAVTSLPRVDKLWYLYVQTEETLGNYQTVRSIFERWLSWKPDRSAWDAYIDFEKRYDEYKNCRDIYLRYVQAFSSSSTGDIWLKWIEFEIDDVPNTADQTSIIRNIFELAVDTLLELNIRANSTTSTSNLPLIISKWSQWETTMGEFERARAIYQILLSETKISLSSEFKQRVYMAYTEFEKSHGDKDTIESSISLKRQLKYEHDLSQDPYDYDSWWSLLNLLESQNINLSSSAADKIRSTYEKSVQAVPKDTYKSILWKRYIFLWIRYALWLEYQQHDLDGARESWQQCLKTSANLPFTFAKVWIHFAQFELRNDADKSDEALSNARKILGKAIGQTSSKKLKPKIFRQYIGMEQKLGEWDRCRRLYEKWLELSLISEVDNTTSQILLENIEFEKSLNESDRVIALYQLGMSLAKNERFAPKFEPIDQLWTSLIEFYKEEFNYENARDLYRELLQTDDYPQIWISMALFESSILTDDQLKDFEESEDSEVEFTLSDVHRKNTRRIFEEANTNYKNLQKNEHRIAVLKAWKEYETAHGDEDSVQVVSNKLPTVVKRRKNVDGSEVEYLDFVFAEDEEAKPQPITGVNKFLANAKKWASQNQKH